MTKKEMLTLLLKDGDKQRRKNDAPMVCKDDGRINAFANCPPDIAVFLIAEPMKAEAPMDVTPLCQVTDDS